MNTDIVTFTKDTTAAEVLAHKGWVVWSAGTEGRDYPYMGGETLTGLSAYEDGDATLTLALGDDAFFLGGDEWCRLCPPPASAVVTTTVATKQAQSSKAPMHLLPGYSVLAPIARAMHAGNELHGYAPGSWKEADPALIRQAAIRHFTQWLDDPDSCAEDTGTSHLVSWITNGIMLLWHRRRKREE